MENFIPTKRNFRNVETGDIFKLYMNQITNEYKLIFEGENHPKMSKGTQVNGWYLSAHTPIEIKLNNSKIVRLGTGDFYNLKEEEEVTHKKYCGFKKFTKI